MALGGGRLAQVCVLPGNVCMVSRLHEGRHPLGSALAHASTSCMNPDRCSSVSASYMKDGWACTQHSMRGVMLESNRRQSNRSYPGLQANTCVPGTVSCQFARVPSTGGVLRRDARVWPPCAWDQDDESPHNEGRQAGRQALATSVATVSDMPARWCCDAAHILRVVSIMRGPPCKPGLQLALHKQLAL